MELSNTYFSTGAIEFIFVNFRSRILITDILNAVETITVKKSFRNDAKVNNSPFIILLFSICDH